MSVGLSEHACCGLRVELLEYGDSVAVISAIRLVVAPHRKEADADVN